MAFALSCPCGNQVEVSEAQAGSWAKCSCGRDVPVPSLRELRQGPASSSPTAISTAPTSSNPVGNAAAPDMSTEEAIKTLFEYAANRMVNGAPPELIRKELVSQGVDEEVAELIVSRLQEARGSALSEAGKRNMLFGALWCIGGILVTAFTYSAAASSPGGGRYVIAWGAIIFGAIQFFRGLSQASEN